MKRTIIALAFAMLSGEAAQANPPVDEVNAGHCLELKVNGQAAPCNNDLRLVDDGKGEVTFVAGYGDGKIGAKMVVAFTTAQTPDMENAYGYALRVNSLTLMPVGAPDTQKHWPATGLCFMVKPNPVRAGTTAIKQDIVVMCSANLTDMAARVRRIDWKFIL
ncbi:hypothetical protein [Methylobacterium sp. 77]|uniref:hypothetical protein n=1 Tax=Methylobacterium sp. 77 TaxID=1101192 RepID=UPI0003789076|nr:hypothetical protein [Methylobacterium sp. 77]